MSFQSTDVFLPTPLRWLTREKTLLFLVPRKPDAPSAVPAAIAVSRSARRDARLVYQRRSALGLMVNCGTRYGHGFLEQVIGIVLQYYTVHQDTRGARVRAKRAGIGLDAWRLERVRSVRFRKKYGPLSRHRSDGTLLCVMFSGRGGVLETDP